LRAVAPEIGELGVVSGVAAVDDDFVGARVAEALQTGHAFGRGADGAAVVHPFDRRVFGGLHRTVDENERCHSDTPSQRDAGVRRGCHEVIGTPARLASAMITKLQAQEADADTDILPGVEEPQARLSRNCDRGHGLGVMVARVGIGKNRGDAERGMHRL
jgi:hypothetical protein